MELLCKVAYSYLGSYGNVQQRSGALKALKALIYLYNL